MQRDGEGDGWCQGLGEEDKGERFVKAVCFIRCKFWGWMVVTHNDILDATEL